jgi:hypothetical protein
MATTPSQQGQQSHCRLRATPAQQRQGCLHINNGNNAIVMRVTIAIATMAKTPEHQWQQCHHDKGNDASLTTSNKGDNASSTTVKMPVQ